MLRFNKCSSFFVRKYWSWKIRPEFVFCPKTSKQIKALQKDLDNKNAIINKEITLNDYFYAQAANIDYIEHFDPDDEILLNDVLNPLNLLKFEHP